MPYKIVTSENCLATTHPELAKQWHPDNKLKPTEVTAGSSERVKWTCCKSHTWEAVVYNRTRTGCPVCAGRIVDETNCLATTHPELAKQWHPDNTLKPTEVTAGSGKKVLWICPTDIRHIWPATILDRKHGRGCSVCASRTVDETNCLATTHPELAKQWHPDNKLKPTEVTFGSHAKVWWKCEDVPQHKWKASIGNRARLGSGCSVCNGKTADETNCLATTHPELAKQWHPDNKLKPTEITAGSHKKVIWRCGKDFRHIWKATIKDRKAGDGCSVCAGRTADETNCLATTHPALAKQWHPDNKLKPTEVTAGSGKKVLWVCSVDTRHEWSAPVSRRTYQASGCPICAGKAVDETNCLSTTHPEFVKQWWHSDNTLKPTEVTFGSHIKVRWKCDGNADHLWEAAVKEVIGGTGCPYCSGLMDTMAGMKRLTTIELEATFARELERNPYAEQIGLMSLGIRSQASCESPEQFFAMMQGSY